MENMLLIGLFYFMFVISAVCIVGLYIIYKELHNINDSLYNIPSNDFIYFAYKYINTNNILEIYKSTSTIHEYCIVIILNNYKYELIEYFDSKDDCDNRYNDLLSQISRFE